MTKQKKPHEIGGRARSPLPPAERRRRWRELWIGLAVFAAIAAFVLLSKQLSGETPSVPVANSTLFLFLNALNVILIALLFFLVARNLVKLVFERRRGILGAHLSLKFVLAFALTAAVPTAALFLVAAFFITSSINTYFSLGVHGALERSREVAEAHYEEAARDMLWFGRHIADAITEQRLLREENREALVELVQTKQREYNLGVIEVFSATGEQLVTAVNPEIPAATFARPGSDFVSSALGGEPASRVASSGTGDVIRGAVPIWSSFRSDEPVGAVVVNSFEEASLTRKVHEIEAGVAEYRTLQPNAGHIRSVYLLELLLTFLVVLMLATWWGFRLAKGVTGPIQALAEGTAEVARGNLDVVVEPTSDDEVGFLVHSFNRMTHDLRDARGGLELTNAELDQRRRYMEIVLRNIGAGVISIDAEGRVNTINPSAQRLLGIPPGAAVIGRKVEEILERPEQLEIVRELSAKLRPGVRETIRQQVQLPVGDEVLTLLVTLTLLQDEDGHALGTVLTFDDYSQLVNVQRMAAWREVARRIAHEIKNPLTPIELSAQRIARRFRGRLPEVSEDRKVFDDCVDTITSQVEGLKILVNEFSNFARLPAARPKPDDLNKILKEAVASYAGTEGVQFSTHLDAGLPTVDLDREQIKRVLTNLIDNAIAAVREQAKAEPGSQTGHVELRTVNDAPLQTVRLEVADDGVGIRPADRRHIFDPYFSTKKGGTGLGLSIVSRIIADHRGYIRQHRNEPRGTRMIIELPIRSV
ncbi:MAG: HAMP domain-containing protein [Deltaproteobacteria bacterium]|nr:MAG: HAMP domain-containing protein [Deltaproteobacteria bacterium]